MSFQHQSGSVLSVNLDRGFGFIGVYNGPTVFFHHGQLRGMGFTEQLTGRRVEFELREGPKGLVALNVRPAGEPAR